MLSDILLRIAWYPSATGRGVRVRAYARRRRITHWMHARYDRQCHVARARKLLKPLHHDLMVRDRRCDSTDAFAASAFAPTSHGIKSSVGADWRDHAGANPLSSRPRSISRQLRDWSGPYSCPAFRGKCRTADDSKGRLVVFLVRISKIYTSGI